MPDFQPVFQHLRALLAEHADCGTVKTDTDGSYTLISSKPNEKGKEEWIGSVQIKKRYVSYHLLPVYCYPELLDDISTALKKKMQGKSCFNFTTVDEPLFRELADLTAHGVARYGEEGKL